MAKETEIKNVTGLAEAENRKEAEYDLVKSLLEAAEYATAEDNITEVKIKRNGKFMFGVNIHPISDNDIRFARKKATEKKKNRNGRNLPKESGEVDNVLFKSWVIYVATTENDQQEIWGNRAIMQKFNLMLPVESIDILLTAGEKNRIFEEVLEISGLNDDEDEEEMDMETFQSGAD